jgi:hypothetical protein
MALGTCGAGIAFIDEWVLELRGPRRSAATKPERRPCTMNDACRHHAADRHAVPALLGSSVWIGLTLAGVAWIGMQLFSSRPAGDAMAVTIWGSASSWTLTALPLFIWMGEILFRTKLSRACSAASRPGCRLPGPAAAHQRGGLHHLRRGVRLVRGHLRHHRQDDAAGAGRRGYPEDITIGSLAGAGTLGLLIPPSIIMIVYGVSADVSIAGCSSPASFPACCWPPVLGLPGRVGAAAQGPHPACRPRDDASRKRSTSRAT